jgi:hypothetical protein
VRTAGDGGCSAPAATRGGRRPLFCGGEPRSSEASDGTLAQSDGVTFALFRSDFLEREGRVGRFIRTAVYPRRFPQHLEFLGRGHVANPRHYFGQDFLPLSIKFGGEDADTRRYGSRDQRA